MNFRKIIQKQIYNILSQKYYLVCFIFFVLTTLLSLVHLCEVWLYRSWSMKDQLWFNSFMDNIGNHRLHGNLSQYLPIDVVYTWVNGSDPLFRSQLADHRRSLIMTSSAECPFANCLPSNYLAGRLGSGVESLKGYSDFEIVNSKMPADKWKLVTLDSPESATNRLAYVEGDVYQAHWTTDGSLLNIYSSNDTIMFQVPCDNMHKISRYALRSWLRVSVKTFWIYENVCKVVVQLNIAALLVLKGKQWSIVHADGMNLNVTAAHLLLELPTKMKSSDYVASRYDDKEELRYSLRSLEMYAPWVRKVFLVTNGQIPNWLELDNPKLCLITHEMIFPNRSHLPTFSSPAIETHLHRIPGLSEKFLYMNDDILFGDHVLPEDFISQREGQKIYLSWPIPDCSNSCPWSWVKDGACDLPCNVSTCAYDGGDCLEEEGDQSQLADFYGDEQGMNHDYDADQQAAETRKRRSAESNKSKEELLRTEENTEKQNAESNRKKMEEELRTEENREKQNAESNREKMEEELRTEENREKQNAESNRKKMREELRTEENREKQNAESNRKKIKEELRTEENREKQNAESNRKKIKEELRTEENREKQNAESNRKKIKEELRTKENREKQNAESNREKMEEELRTEENREKQNAESNRNKMREELRTEENREKQNVESNREKMKEELRITIEKSLYPFSNSTSKTKQMLNDIFSDQKLEQTRKRQSVESNKTKEELITEESRVKRNADSHTKKMKEELKTTVDKSFHFFLDCASKARRLYNDIFPYRHKKCRCGYFRRVINSSVNITLVTAQCRYLWNDLLSRRTLKMRAFRPEGSGDVHHRFRRDVSNGTVPKMFENVGLSRRDNVEKDRNSYNNQIKNAAKARAKELGKQFLYNNTERPRKLDTYAESLLHVNTLLNNRYGFKRRKVPAHMPHLIDRTIITELQKTFPEEFKMTSSRKIRSPRDMQFAFSYFYFLMGEEILMTVEQIFDIFDTDKTGTWSDREIRTILTRLYPLPLQRSSIVGFEQLLLNCAQKWPTAPDTTTPMYERYWGSVLPLIKKSMVVECKEVSNVLRKKFGSKKRFPHVIMQHQDTVGFYMVGSNLSDLILSLDSIRGKPKKFICLNDNMDTSRSDDNEIVTAALIDFYHSLFPQPSQFELPAEFVNRFLYYDDYLVWKQHHDFVSNCITIFVILVGSFGFVIFKNELRWLLKKLIKIWRGEKIISRKRSNTRTTQNDVILNIT